MVTGAVISGAEVQLAVDVQGRCGEVPPEVAWAGSAEEGVLVERAKRVTRQRQGAGAVLGAQGETEDRASQKGEKVPRPVAKVPGQGLHNQGGNAQM